MSTFNLKTNRIINGICEFCGIPAEKCPHYSNNAPRPLDEKDKLSLSPNPIPPQKVPVREVMPLTDDEKAKTVEEAEVKKAEVSAEEVKKTRRGRKPEAEEVTETPEVSE